MTTRFNRHGGASFRGQPLVLLAVLLAGWTALRVSFWEPSPVAAQGEIVAASSAALARGDVPGPATADAALRAPLPAVVGRTTAPTARVDPVAPLMAAPSWPQPLAPLSPVAVPTTDLAVPIPPSVAAPPPAAVPPPPVPTRLVVGHNLLLLAGLANMEIPQAILAYLPQPVPPAKQVPAAGKAPALGRWSADGWLMLRQDSASPLLSGRPGYGRSQVGAVVRYRLDPASLRAPQVQVRVSRALAGMRGGARESEVAAGLSVRPVPAIPVRVAAEMRLAQTDRGTRTSPAAYAVTELPPVALPLGLRGEAYAQGGYVGGEFATPFVDGQARVDRALVAVRGVQLRAGGGVWGGAQRGAARLDVGPSAALTFRVGDAQGRVAADYRFRVAGTAQPSSGPAITLSAGF